MVDVKNEMPKGLTSDMVLEISNIKNEPEWMRDYRVKSFNKFREMPLPSFGPILNINFDDITYYKRASDKVYDKWDNVPEDARTKFSDIGLQEAESKYLGGVGAQFESEVIYHNMLSYIEDKKVIFLDTDTALKKYPDLFKKYFNKIVNYDENKFTALNGAVWSGGSFIYVPPGVKLDRPLQSYFFINSKEMGQFERTIIIVDEGAE
jgi:Fe-S cluster assembly protein SufB